jgi:hypothetical protein
MVIFSWNRTFKIWTIWEPYKMNRTTIKPEQPFDHSITDPVVEWPFENRTENDYFYSIWIPNYLKTGQKFVQFLNVSDIRVSGFRIVTVLTNETRNWNLFETKKLIYRMWKQLWLVNWIVMSPQFFCETEDSTNKAGCFGVVVCSIDNYWWFDLDSQEERAI